ncbi:MAG: cohesin domain-containing protein [candidate division KSB1 bacterium]|nr:cohesin domain-containing protein [candidate division KSB1 bacterium]
MRNKFLLVITLCLMITSLPAMSVEGALQQALFIHPAFGYMGAMFDSQPPNAPLHKGLDICQGFATPNCNLLSSPPGPDVRAVYAGTVKHIYYEVKGVKGWHDLTAVTDGRASVVVLEHTGLPNLNNLPNWNGKLYTLYLHMAKQDGTRTYISKSLKVGDFVYQGQWLGNMGDWKYFGYPITFTHLHFGLSQYDNTADMAIDPSLYFGFDVNANHYSDTGHIHYGDIFPPLTNPNTSLTINLRLGSLVKNTPVSVEVRFTGFGFYSGTTAFQTTCTTDASGNCNGLVLNGVVAGNYYVLVKPQSWLRKGQVLNLTSGIVLDWSAYFSAGWGDLDEDNMIDTSDLARVINDFKIGVLKPGCKSDLDRDGYVDSMDLGIVINNFAMGVYGAGGAMPTQDYSCAAGSAPVRITKAPSAPSQLVLIQSGVGRKPGAALNSYQVGDVISLTVQYDTGGKSSDGIKSIINYDPGVLQLHGIKKESSGFSHNGVVTTTQGIEFQVYNYPADTPVSGSGQIVTIGLKAISSTPITTVTLKLESGLNWNSKIVEHGTAQDVLSQVVNTSFAVTGSPARPLRTGSILSPFAGSYINTKFARVDFASDDPAGGIDKIDLEAFYNGAWHAVGTIDSSINGNFKPGMGAGGVIFSTLAQPDGRILIGGNFTTVNGIPRRSIARLNRNGTLDTQFTPGTGDGWVQSMLLQPDGKVIVGFMEKAAPGNLKIMRLNQDGSLDTGFNVYTSCCGGIIYAVALQPDGKILVGGYFGNAIVRLNSDGSLDTSFNLGVSVNWVRAIAIQSDGKILIGGNLGTGNIARLNSNGTLDTGFNPNPGANAQVTSIGIADNGQVLISGSFSQVNNVNRKCIARLNSDGSLDSNFAPNISDANCDVRSLATQPDGKILLGGQFTQIDGVNHNNIARLNNDGTLDAGFNPGSGANGMVNAVVVQLDDKVLIGGEFTNVNGQTAKGIMRLDPDGSTSWKMYWDTTGVPDQVINLRAFVGDYAKNGIWLSANGIILDKTMPSYMSHTISPGNVLPGQLVTINLQSQDNLAGVDHTDVYVNTATDGSGNGDWNLVGAINGCCGSVVWNTTGYQRGRHRIAFDIWDKAGNSNNWVFGSQPIITVPLGEQYQYLPFIRK